MLWFKFSMPALALRISLSLSVATSFAANAALAASSEYCLISCIALDISVVAEAIRSVSSLCLRAPFSTVLADWLKSFPKTAISDDSERACSTSSFIELKKVLNVCPNWLVGLGT